MKKILTALCLSAVMPLAALAEGSQYFFHKLSVSILNY